MDAIKGKLAAVGGFMALAGLVSAVLSFIDYELRILMWVDQWGTGFGWGIRVGLIVVGVALWFLAGGGGGDDEAEAQE